MTTEFQKARWLYRKLLTLYPRAFRERLGESMAQTFNDLCNEHTRESKSLSGFLINAFLETGVGIVYEHFLVFKEMNPMQKALTHFSLSAFVSFLLTVPLLIMEIVNRGNFNEEFPIALFFGIWLNLFAISLILLPILAARWTGTRETRPTPAQGFLQSPTMISVGLVLALVLVFLLASAVWEPLQVSGSNAESLQVYGVQVSSQFLALVAYLLPAVVGIMAGGPIVNTLLAGGSLFAHRISLIVVVAILFLFVAGVVGILADQWPCFVGVQFCD